MSRVCLFRYDVMQITWSNIPEKRPEFSQLATSLENILAHGSPTDMKLEPSDYVVPIPSRSATPADEVSNNLTPATDYETPIPSLIKAERNGSYGALDRPGPPLIQTSRNNSYGAIDKPTLTNVQD